MTTRSIISEFARRERDARKETPGSIAARLMEPLSDLQRAFISDPHRLKIARCGRRGGKTYADVAYMVKVCLSKPKARVLYLSATQDSAMDIIWQPLMDIIHKHKVSCRPYESTRRIVFANGSRIRILGADSDKAKNRLRGVPYDLVIVDECGYVAEVDELVDIILPSLADYGGSLCLTSSPPEIKKGLFYEADQGDAKKFWHSYYWTMHDNPFFMGPPKDPSKYATLAEEEMALICALKYGGNDQHPTYRREWWGEYVTDTSKLLYPYSPKNIVKSVPEYKDGRYVLGIDFGVTSESAISVINYSPSLRSACIVDIWKGAGTLTDEFAALIKRYMFKYNPDVIVADLGGLGKVYGHELTTRYNLPIRAAAKTDKIAFQRILGNDLLSGYVNVLLPQAQLLVDEWSTLLKGPDGLEIKGGVNHASDATLYAYRHVYSTVFETLETPETEEEMMVRNLLEEVASEREERDGFNF